MLEFHAVGSCLGYTIEKRDGVVPFQYCAPRHVLFNNLSSDPNEVHMQNVCP
jgi:hypothetical protein